MNKRWRGEDFLKKMRGQFIFRPKIRGPEFSENLKIKAKIYEIEKLVKFWSSYSQDPRYPLQG